MAGANGNFDDLIRERVKSSLSGVSDAPDRLAKIVGATIAEGVLGGAGKAKVAPSEATVRAACRGAMGGMILIHGELPKTAIAVLNELSHSANTLGVDPMELMTWAMRGFADNARSMTPQQVNEIHVAIDSAYMGAGEMFHRLCEEAAG